MERLSNRHGEHVADFSNDWPYSPHEQSTHIFGLRAQLPEEMNGLLVEAAGAFARFVAIHQTIIKGYSYGIASAKDVMASSICGWKPRYRRFEAA